MSLRAGPEHFIDGHIQIKCQAAISLGNHSVISLPVHHNNAAPHSSSKIGYQKDALISGMSILRNEYLQTKRICHIFRKNDFLMKMLATLINISMVKVSRPPLVTVHPGLHNNTASADTCRRSVVMNTIIIHVKGTYLWKIVKKKSEIWFVYYMWRKLQLSQLFHFSSTN